MSRLDVVAELAAHQQNLVPEPGRARAALIALPPPALLALIAPGVVRALGDQQVSRVIVRAPKLVSVVAA